MYLILSFIWCILLCFEHAVHSKTDAKNMFTLFFYGNLGDILEICTNSDDK